jgi:ribosomal protein L37AE/L43A
MTGFYLVRKCPRCGHPLSHRKAQKAFKCSNPNCAVHFVNFKGDVIAEAATPYAEALL